MRRESLKDLAVMGTMAELSSKQVTFDFDFRCFGLNSVRVTCKYKG